MGSSVASLSDATHGQILHDVDNSNPFKLSLEQWIESQDFTNSKRVVKILSNQGFNDVEKLYWANHDIEKIAKLLPKYGDRATLRQAVNKLVDYKKLESQQQEKSNKERQSDDDKQEKTDEKKNEGNNGYGLRHENPVDTHPPPINNVASPRGFDLNVKILTGKTRIDNKRPLLIGMFEKHSLSHASVRVIYFDERYLTVKEKTQRSLMVRIFILELFVKQEKVKNNQVILSIKGPIYNLKDVFSYYCKTFYPLNTSISNIMQTAKLTMENYTKYSLIFNNCRHFSQQLINTIEKSENQETKQKCIDGGVVQCYIKEYFKDSFVDATVDKMGNVNVKNYDKNARLATYPITFEQVVTQFESHNENNIAKQGWLKKKSRFLKKWRKRYCVLTKEKILETYKTEKMKDKTEMIHLAARTIKIDDTEPTMFEIGIFQFDCDINDLNTSDDHDNTLKNLRDAWVDIIAQVCDIEKKVFNEHCVASSRENSPFA